MAEDSRSTSYEHLVHEWSGRVHNLAYRLLGCRADADDATQEVFIRLWERIESYDPARPFQPWIYRVATRSILNRIRAEARRDKRHAQAPLRDAVATVEEVVDRRETESLVHEGLQRIGAEERALLSMHYYGGLTHEQIAVVVDAPRTTVQSRLARALVSLRTALAPSHALVALPWVESVMRESSVVPADDAVVSKLLSIPGTAAAGAAVAPTILGGVLVTKKLVLAAVLFAFLGAGAGFVTGRGLASRAPGEGAAGPAEYARLADENRALQDALSARDRSIPNLAAAAPHVPSSAVPGREPVPADAPASAESGSKAERLDWSSFSKLFAANGERMSRSMLDHEQLDPADSATVLAAFAEFMRVCSSARTISPNPFFDERVLPDMAVALFGDAVGLTAQQKKALGESARNAVRAHAAQIDFERAGPLELLEAREQVSNEVFQAAGSGLDSKARDRLGGLEPLTRVMMLGGQTVVRIGMSPGPGDGSVASQLLNEWKEAYGLDERQADSVRPLAERYALDAGDVLRRRGLDRSDPTASKEDEAAAVRDIVRLGIQAERAILADLPAPQRSRTRSNPPTLVLLRPGAGLTKLTLNLGGL